MSTMKPSVKLRVAIVGLGWVAIHRHIPTMLADPCYDIIGVIDHHPGRAQKIAAQFGFKFYAEDSSLHNVNWLDQVDALTIAAAPQAHHPLIAEALALGKHVLTEKPFTLTVSEGEALYELAISQQVTLGVVHNFQFSRSFQKLEADLINGRIGSLKAIIARQFGNPRRRLPEWYQKLPLGLFYDESPHFFYLLHRLTKGKISLLRADMLLDASNSPTPAVIECLYSAELEHRIIPVSMHINFEASLSEWHILVTGDQGCGIVDLFRDIYIWLPNDEAHTTLTVLRTSWMTWWQHWLQHITSGLKHLRGHLRYGNDEVFRRFAEAALTAKPLDCIGSAEALAILRMQHDVIAMCRSFSQEKNND